MSRKLTTLGALAAGFGFVPPLQAQDAPDAATLPAVRARAAAEPEGRDAYQATHTTAGKGRQELRDIPQGVTVVTEKLMDDKAQDTLKAALHGVGGITFEAGEGGGIGDLIRLRGFSARGDMYIDGLRDIAQYNRDNFNADRVEVLRGAASMLYGRGSTGGIVNQASKAPTLFAPSEIAVTLGTSEYVRATVDVNQRTGEDAALRVNAMLTQAESTRSGGAGGPSTNRLGVAPTFRWGIGTRDEFSVGLYHLQYDDVPDYGFRWYQERPVDAAAQRWYGSASDYQRDAATVGTLSHLHRFDGGGELKTTLREGRYKRDLWATTAGFAAPLPGSLDQVTDSTAISRGNQTRGAEDHHRFLTSDYSGRARWFGLDHALLAGAEVARERTHVYSYAGVPAKANTTWGDASGTGAVVDTRVAAPQTDFSARTVGVYAQDTLAITPTVKLVGGLRFDRFEAEYTSLAFTPQVTWQRNDSLWSRRAGLLWQPDAQSTYYASWGTAFNTTGDLYQFGVAGGTPEAREAAAQRSAATPPEKSRNFELGTKWELADGDLNLRAAVFRTEKTNERNTDTTTADAQPLLSAGRHTDGIEVEAAGRPAPGIELFGSLAWMKGRIDAAAPNLVGTAADPTGLEPGLTPRWSGGVWATWQATPALRMGFGFDGRSGTKPALAETGSNVAPGYVKADALVEYRLEPVTFKLNLINLFDRTYADGIYRGFTVPGAGRSAQVTVATRF